MATVPLLLAPAMNREMWAHPGHAAQCGPAIGPGWRRPCWAWASGDQACGETGDGRMLEPAEIVQDVVAYFQPQSRCAGAMCW